MEDTANRLPRTKNMQKYTVEKMNLDGTGDRPYRVFAMPSRNAHDYWASVTDVTCPVCENGTIRWAEAGYVPGYRKCDVCRKHFLAQGNAKAPTLIRMRSRQGW